MQREFPPLLTPTQVFVVQRLVTTVVFGGGAGCGGNNLAELECASTSVMTLIPIPSSLSSQILEQISGALSISKLS